jgi:hypothetical protein
VFTGFACTTKIDLDKIIYMKISINDFNKAKFIEYDKHEFLDCYTNKIKIKLKIN